MSMTSSIYDEELYSSSFLFTSEEYLSVKSHTELPLKCSHCSETFYRKKKQITRDIKLGRTSFYCCKECQFKGQRKPKEERTYTCKMCGKAFTELPSKYASGNFCSSLCARKYSSQFANTEEKRKQKSDTECDKLGIPRKETLLHTRKYKEEYKQDQNKNIVIKIPKPVSKRQNTPKTKLCKICGQEKCLHPNICRLGIIQQKSKALSALGFNFSKVGTIEIYNEYFRIKDFLYDLYINKEKSILDIMKEYQIKHIRSLELLFIRFEIPRRTFSESCLLAYAKDKISPPVNPMYKTGWHTTWEGKSYFHRSSYELDYMNELDEKQIPYDCEALRIRYYDSVKQKYRTAIPDFYLPDTKTIVEVKCRRTYNKQEMIDKVKEYKRLGFSFRLLYEHIMYDNCI